MLEFSQEKEKEVLIEFNIQEFIKRYLKPAILHGGKEDVTSPNNITFSRRRRGIGSGARFSCKDEGRTSAKYPTKIYSCRFVDMNLSGFMVMVAEPDKL